MLSKRFTRRIVIGRNEKLYTEKTRSGQFGLRRNDKISTMLGDNQCHCLCMDNTAYPLCPDCGGKGTLNPKAYIRARRAFVNSRK